MKKVWVLGSSGMLGRAIVRSLEKKKIFYLLSQREEVSLGSYQELKAFALKHGPTHLINCAAYTNVEKAEEEKDAAFVANVMGPLHLGSLAREFNIKVVHFSTDYVFDGKKGEPYIEDELCLPLSVYGKTKRAGELQLLALSESALVLRTSWLFGIEGNHFVKKMAELMQKEEVVKVVDDQRGRPSFADDMAEASLQLMPCSGIFHIANQGESSWFQWAKAIHAQLLERGKKIACKDVWPISSQGFSMKARRPGYSVLSTEKAEKMLNYKFRHWREGLCAYFDMQEAKSVAGSIR